MTVTESSAHANPTENDRRRRLTIAAMASTHTVTITKPVYVPSPPVQVTMNSFDRHCERYRRTLAITNVTAPATPNRIVASAESPDWNAGFGRGAGFTPELSADPLQP